MNKQLKQAWIDFNNASLGLHKYLKRSANYVGEMAENLALDYYGGAQNVVSTSSFDLTDNNGRKIQVKSRRIMDIKKSGNICDIRSNHQDFDLLVVILFNETGDILLVKEYTKKEIQILSPNPGRNNAHVVSVDKILKDKTVGEEITKLFKQTIGW